MKILVTGDRGFMGSYVVKLLLEAGNKVVGIDSNIKYGPTEKSYDNNKNYESHIGDARNIALLKELIGDCDHMINFASRLGGIAYFHQYPFTIISENEELYASAFETAIWASKNKKLKKITLLSSSMVYESTDKWPSKEEDIYTIQVPKSSYGFQKLATHFWAEAAKEQYELDYTILIPFNCCGIGETTGIDEVKISIGNIELGRSHVIIDLVKKILLGFDPLPILGNGNQIRHYTPGEELAKGIVLSLEHPFAINESFNLSTPIGHTVKELSAIIWKKINGNKELKFIYEEPFKHDVQKRVPNTSKAKEVLGFEVKMTLEESLDIIIPWVDEMLRLGKI